MSYLLTTILFLFPFQWNLFPARSPDDRQSLDDPLNASTGSQSTCGAPVAASTPAKGDSKAPTMAPMAGGGESVTENDLQVTAMSDKNYDVRTAPPPISYESDQRCRYGAYTIVRNMIH